MRGPPRSFGDLVGVDGCQAFDVEDRSDGDVGVGAEVVADPGLGDWTAAFDVGDAVGVGSGVDVDVDDDAREELRPVQDGLVTGAGRGGSSGPVSSSGSPEGSGGSSGR
jgi:hypothetical protein